MNMTPKSETPQWLKEVLSRGFKPKKIYHDFDKSLFGYVNTQSSKTKSFPNIKIFTLEGLSGSGKKSVVNALRNYKKITTVKQILPKEPKFDQDMGQDFYFKSDQLKTERCVRSKNLLCLLDRYYVSTLAFYWAYDKIHNTKTYKRAFDWYKNTLARHQLIKPFTVFYIDTPLKESFKRKERKPNKSTEDLWLNKEFLNYFTYFHKHFYSEIEPQTRVVFMDGKLPLNRLLKKIKSELHEAK